MILGIFNVDYQTYIKSEHEIYNKVRSMALNGDIICPDCTRKVAMHGTYKRKIIFSEFIIEIVPIVQVRCKECRKVHAVLPDFIFPKKQYYSELIRTAVNDDSELQTCTADDSTIRRWRRFYRR